MSERVCTRPERSFLTHLGPPAFHKRLMLEPSVPPPSRLGSPRNRNRHLRLPVHRAEAAGWWPPTAVHRVPLPQGCGAARLTSHICSWKIRRSFSISSAISAPLISVRIIPCSLACSFFSFSIFVLQVKKKARSNRMPFGTRFRPGDLAVVLSPACETNAH